MARQLQEDMRETDNKKRILEDQLDQMNAELNALKQQEQKAQGMFYFIWTSQLTNNWSL